LLKKKNSIFMERWLVWFVFICLLLLAKLYSRVGQPWHYQNRRFYRLSKYLMHAFYQALDKTCAQNRVPSKTQNIACFAEVPERQHSTKNFAICPCSQWMIVGWRRARVC
jgi:hypothetical protein